MSKYDQLVMQYSNGTGLDKLEVELRGGVPLGKDESLAILLALRTRIAELKMREENYAKCVSDANIYRRDLSELRVLISRLRNHHYAYNPDCEECLAILTKIKAVPSD